MTQNDKVNELFRKVLTESEIKHFFIRGFDKYIACNEQGTLFVVWINKTAQKRVLGRTTLMKKKYIRAKLPFNVMPDCEFLCDIIVQEYKIQQLLDRDLKPIFDIFDSFYNDFCKKTK